jgi:hypothetical protein
MAKKTKAKDTPRKSAVHADAPEEAGDAVEAVNIEDKSPAEWAYERLVVYIQEFESQLDNQHEVAMGFAGSDAGIVQIEGLGFFDPDIVTFFGTDEDGARVQLIQHVTQLSVVLRAMPKAPEEDAPRRIGFRLAKRLGKAKKGA